MSSKVYFTNLRTSPGHSLIKKMESLVTAAGMQTIDFKDKFTAIKIHFGEVGNMAYLRPNYAARIVDMIRALGGKPFLTDSNTLYSGSRSNAVDHLHCAAENGYNPISAHCPVIIADGLKGNDIREIPIGGEYCPAPKIGAAIAQADIIISMTHFKGHEQAGFGGALKNLGMGSASVAGKLELHSSSKPAIDVKNCRGCNICVKHCAHDAVHLEQMPMAETGPAPMPATEQTQKPATKQTRKAVIDYEKCVGCGQCVALCQYEGAVVKDWDSTEVLNCKIAEYTQAVINGKPNFHISFIVDVSPECDCWGHNDSPLVPNIGILASFDPVALDQACADLTLKAPKIIYSNMLEDLHYTPDTHEDDIFHIVHPNTDWRFALEHGEKIGLGSRKYELKTVE